MQLISKPSVPESSSEHHLWVGVVPSVPPPCAGGVARSSLVPRGDARSLRILVRALEFFIGTFKGGPKVTRGPRRSIPRRMIVGRIEFAVR